MTNSTTLVLGATGKTGRRVAARLRLRGTPVRAASRSSRTPFDWNVLHAPLVSGELALPAGAVPEPFIDLEDVADVAAAVLAEPGRHAGRVYELTGPRSLTFAEAVELISRASGQSITYRQITPAEYTARLADQGLSEDDAHHVTEMFVMMERGVIAGTTDGVATVLGRAPRTFEDYVVRAAAAGAWRG